MPASFSLMLPYEDPYSLSLLFHWNSEPWRNVDAYNDPHSRHEFKRVAARTEAIPLPPVKSSTLDNLTALRRSRRDFAPLPLALGQLARILDSAYGVTPVRETATGACTFARPVPSAGGLYPLEIYALANRVAELAQGIYHFHAADRVLEPVAASVALHDLIPDLMNQQFLAEAGALLFFAAVFPRTLEKYGARGYRYVLIEAGHVAQNVCLLAAELGLSAVCVGGFTDHRINRLLKLDQRSEGVVYALAVGHPHTRSPEE